MLNDQFCGIVTNFNHIQVNNAAMMSLGMQRSMLAEARRAVLAGRNGRREVGGAAQSYF